MEECQDTSYPYMELLGITLSCPKGLSDQDCPVASLRGHPIQELAQHFGTLTFDQVQTVLKHHQECWDRPRSHDN